MIKRSWSSYWNAFNQYFQIISVFVLLKICNLQMIFYDTFSIQILYYVYNKTQLISIKNNAFIFLISMQIRLQICSFGSNIIRECKCRSYRGRSSKCRPAYWNHGFDNCNSCCCVRLALIDYFQKDYHDVWVTYIPGGSQKSTFQIFVNNF